MRFSIATALSLIFMQLIYLSKQQLTTATLHLVLMEVYVHRILVLAFLVLYPVPAHLDSLVKDVNVSRHFCYKADSFG